MIYRLSCTVRYRGQLVTRVTWHRQNFTSQIQVRLVVVVVVVVVVVISLIVGATAQAVVAGNFGLA